MLSSHRCFQERSQVRDVHCRHGDVHGQFPPARECLEETAEKVAKTLVVIVSNLISPGAAGFELPPRRSANISWLHHVH